MKTLQILTLAAILMFAIPIFSQNRIAKNLADTGNKIYTASEVVEFKPGYYYAGKADESMLAQIGRTATIKWSMEERYGVDFNKNGLVIDLPNSPSYANPQYFQVKCSLDFFAPQPQEFGNEPCVDCTFPTDCIWYVNGATNYPVENPQEKYNPVFKFQDEITYYVRAELIFEHKGKKIIYYTPITEITPNDILIVALGDSFASGEGNPDQTKLGGQVIWADATPPDPIFVKNWNHALSSKYDVTENHKFSHRSTTVWSSLTAIQIEKSDPHTSVTYVNLGSGGAEIEDLINRNQEKDLGTMPFKQIEEATTIIGDRKIEALTLNIGGNNLGFMSAIISYIFNRDKDLIRTAIMIGDWSIATAENPLYPKLLDLIPNVDWEHVSGFISLPNLYDQLNSKIKQNFPKLDNVYIMQYPDICNGCEEVLEYNIHNADLNPRVNKSEIQHSETYLRGPLNKLIVEKASKFGWVCLSSDSWGNHGACKYTPLACTYTNAKPGFHQLYSSLPYPKMTNDGYKWANSIDDSQIYQDDIKGSAHPNAFGHLAMAESFSNVITPNNGALTNQVYANRYNGDFNGDAQPDALFFGKKGASVQLSGNLSIKNRDIWLASDSGVEDFWTVGDFNGDGKDDILATYAGIGVKVFLSDGSSFQYSGVWTTAGVGIEGFWTVGDFTGDGKDDILRTEPNGEVQVFTSIGYSFTGPAKWSDAGLGTLGFWTVGDFTGDGRDDILRMFQGAEVLESKLPPDIGFKSPKTWGYLTLDPFFKVKNKGWIVGYFDDDKKADLAQVLYESTSSGMGQSIDRNKIEVALSTGTAFNGLSSWYNNKIPKTNNPPFGGISIGSFIQDDYSFLVGDLTGDKIFDILALSPFKKDVLLVSQKNKNFVEDVRWQER